ncbi:amidase signature domain-containing protein [Mariannaea sp. PMI_226]|nr:amidase signature domain-containing protein [Mariannaea sp. PMI_226]
MPSSKILSVAAQPYAFAFDPAHTALLVIDMQRDFLLPGGFGHAQGANLDAVQASIGPTKKLLEACRDAGLKIFHTREGHKPDLSDCPSSKLVRQSDAPDNVHHNLAIGDKGKMGRILIQGEYGHDIIDELQPLPDEVIIDKPGKGAFWNTTLMHQLKSCEVTHLIVSGVTTECCFATTIKEANDRGFECCGIEEATAGYYAEFKPASLDILYSSQGLFGFVAKLNPLLEALEVESKSRASRASTNTPPETPPDWDGDLRIESLQRSYRVGVSPITVIEALYRKIEAYKATDPAVWIELIPKDKALQAAQALVQQYPDRTKRPALFGVPFSIKDSLDVVGLPTTTACPPLANIPSRSAVVYDKAIANGSIFIGKTNLDQLATGLSGCRSPYGITHSVFHPDYISGGSSSGSCVSVGAGLCSFSIATDTAGSGRVPSCFNGVVGYKPTRGTLSAVGLTPACLSLDCIAIISKTVQDAATVSRALEGFDENDPYAKPVIAFERHINSIGPLAKSFKFGIPPAEALSVCSVPYRRLFNETITKLQSIGGILTPIDWSPFEKAGRLLYEGSFVCERLASLPDDWLQRNRGHLHPVIVELFDQVIQRNSSAVQAYRDLQAKVRHTREAEKVFTEVDFVLVPTTTTHWTIEEMLADPIRRNSMLGEFTHSGNVLDLCAVAVPITTYPASELSGKPDDTGELPFGVTLLGGSRLDAETLRLARIVEEGIKSNE